MARPLEGLRLGALAADESTTAPGVLPAAERG